MVKFRFIRNLPRTRNRNFCKIFALQGEIMMVGHTNKLKLTLWVSAVYVLSFICYVPTLLGQSGIIIPNGLLYLKYLYVCIPTMAAIFLLICEKNIKVYFTQMFSGKIGNLYQQFLFNWLADEKYRLRFLSIMRTVQYRQCMDGGRCFSRSVY